MCPLNKFIITGLFTPSLLLCNGVKILFGDTRIFFLYGIDFTDVYPAIEPASVPWYSWLLM
jgi:hypothetical protein